MKLLLLNAYLGIRNDFKLPASGLLLLKALYLSRSYCVQVLKKTLLQRTIARLPIGRLRLIRHYY